LTSFWFMRIFNPDASEAGACGNATRCVAAFLHVREGMAHPAIETAAGLLRTAILPDGRVEADMGLVRLQWDAIPLARPCDTLNLPLSVGPLSSPTAVSVGNPHAVFFVPDAEVVDLGRWGPILENDPLFPQRCNIEAVSAVGVTTLRMRVWERGAGITPACGSGACAAAVAAVRRGLVDRAAPVRVLLDGGALDIVWRADGHVLMTGPAACSFEGTIDLDRLTQEAAL
jgi:diaminopimelate epimerase